MYLYANITRFKIATSSHNIIIIIKWFIAKPQYVSFHIYYCHQIMVLADIEKILVYVLCT